MMFILYLAVFVFFIIFSAFFSSAETSLLSLDKINLNLKAKQKHKKAVLLSRILKRPDEFFSTILIGNNFVNIAAASISTVLFARLIKGDDNLTMLVSTLVTTGVILIFAEILPKSYAFRYSKRLAYLYAYPINFFRYLLFPFVKLATGFANFFLNRNTDEKIKKEFSSAEIKHFLSSETTHFKYNPEYLNMINEIIDIVQKDIKSIMTPRPDIVALEENAEIQELKTLIVENKLTKIPLFKDNLDNITGIIDTRNIVSLLLENNFFDQSLRDISQAPIFISEYSSLRYVIKRFKRFNSKIAVIVDEYGTTIGILTLSDIFREILGDIKMGQKPIKKTGANVLMIKGHVPVEEINSQYHLNLPQKKEYTTISGLFVFHYGKIPKPGIKIKIDQNVLIVNKMGRRKIEEIKIITST